MPNRILVTGATGLIGSHIINFLKEWNAGFKALVRNTEKADALNQKGISTVPGNYNDHSSLVSAMSGCEKLLLLTPPTADQDKLAHHAIEAAKTAGIKHIVKISAVGASIDSPVQIGKMHGASELELRNSGIAWTILRPHSFMQNFIGSAVTIRQGQFFGTTGDVTIPFIDARDIAEVAARVLTQDGHSGQTYTLTGPEAISNGQIAQAFSDALGHHVEYINVPFEAARQGMIQAGMPEWLADDLTMLNQFWAKGMGTEATNDARKILGHDGRTVNDFARDHARFFQ